MTGGRRHYYVRTKVLYLRTKQVSFILNHIIKCIIIRYNYNYNYYSINTTNEGSINYTFVPARLIVM
jgi:hypothetical protein